MMYSISFAPKGLGTRLWSCDTQERYNMHQTITHVTVNVVGYKELGSGKMLRRRADWKSEGFLAKLMNTASNKARKERVLGPLLQAVPPEGLHSCMVTARTHSCRIDRFSPLISYVLQCLYVLLRVTTSGLYVYTYINRCITSVWKTSEYIVYNECISHMQTIECK